MEIAYLGSHDYNCFFKTQEGLLRAAAWAFACNFLIQSATVPATDFDYLPLNGMCLSCLLTAT